MDFFCDGALLIDGGGAHSFVVCMTAGEAVCISCQEGLHEISLGVSSGVIPSHRTGILAALPMHQLQHVTVQDRMYATLGNKELTRKMSATNAKALNTMRQRLRKHNPQFAEQVPALPVGSASLGALPFQKNAKM